MKPGPLLLGVACASLLAGGCATPGVSGQGTAAGPAASSPAAGVLVGTEGPGWSPGALSGPGPAPGTCRLGRAADGRPLPDAHCTPGAVDTTVTQANLSQTICRVGGYTSSVRPPQSLTEPFKLSDLAAYSETGSLGLYELDHLVPLELGGSSDTANLWTEPDDHPPGAANSKDPVENELHDLVCAAVHGHGYLPLVEAQMLIASDWTVALARAQTHLVDP